MLSSGEKRIPGFEGKYSFLGDSVYNHSYGRKRKKNSKIGSYKLCKKIAKNKYEYATYTIENIHTLLDQSEKKLIKGYKHEYYADRNGNVYKKIIGGYKKLQPQKHNYRKYTYVQLVQKNNKKTALKIADIIHKVFVGNIHPGYTTYYKNGDIFDNKLSNLGLQRWNCIKTPKRVAQIENGKVINQFLSAREASIKTGTCFESIYFVCRGTYKSAGGYQRKYI